ncbi:hypothetical protein L3X38_002022 [Prunus dulcis]|uniref:DNA (cytosine-5-)-methyltransferase n=1 Tax=Prunus dulcis TaxID=3755 RepID=A0AAD4ZKD4_PRUDU|nr:hypothetical protein L3X38_002022 [Prunus dulcis]
MDGDWRPSFCSLWSIVILYFPSLLQLIHFKKVSMTNYSNRKSSSEQECEKAIVPKEEILDFELPSDAAFSGHFGNNAASSSGSNTRSDLIGMGFLPSLVDKVIEQKGEGDVELLLEALLSHSGSQKSDSGSSDSLDSLFDDKDESSPPKVSNIIQPKEEPDLADGLDEGKRASLLMMNFSPNEVEFAIDKLGEDAPINDLVDFIIAAQVAVKLENDIGDSTTHGDEEKDEDANDEKLYGTMEKTLRLLEMGFSENQVSWAIEKFGSRAPIGDLADSIVAYQISDDCYKENKCSAHSNHSRTGVGSRFFATGSYDSVKVENEEFHPHTVSQSRDCNAANNFLGKRPKQEYNDDDSNVVPTAVPQFRAFRHVAFEEKRKGKRPRQEYVDNSSTFLDQTWMEEKVDPIIGNLEMSKPFKSNPCKSVNRMMAKPPYFFYGNIVNLAYDSWAKISQFLYGLEPEYVNTQLFSALNRREGYVHNLPTENRFHILPKPPMTVEDAIPHTKKWWPSWDTRKQLTCICSETSGISQLCDRLGRVLSDSRGLLSSEQQRDVLHQCRSLNLVWVGRYKLSPTEPEYLERILGYPLNHTQVAESSLTERLLSLKFCFQTDTLGYHLSALKSMYPGGLTVFSIFSGIGGAEVALHRLGISLKGVVSVETNATKRKILRRWWENTGQTGQLEQIEDVHKLTSTKLESLMKKFGGFDLIICQHPCSDSISKISPQSDSLPGFDFSLFYEFVRVLQRVRTMSERKK